MFKNLKDTHHTVEHEVNVNVKVDPQTTLLLKAVGAIAAIQVVAHIANRLVDQKFKS
jgi:hypothetical protein